MASEVVEIMPNLEISMTMATDSSSNPKALATSTRISSNNTNNSSRRNTIARKQLELSTKNKCVRERELRNYAGKRKRKLRVMGVVLLDSKGRLVGTTTIGTRMGESTMSTMAIRRTSLVSFLRIHKIPMGRKASPKVVERAIATMEGLGLMTFSSKIKMLSLANNKVSGSKRTISRHSNNGKSNRTNNLEIQ